MVVGTGWDSTKNYPKTIPEHVGSGFEWSGAHMTSSDISIRSPLWIFMIWTQLSPTTRNLYALILKRTFGLSIMNFSLEGKRTTASPALGQLRSVSAG